MASNCSNEATPKSEPGIISMEKEGGSMIWITAILGFLALLTLIAAVLVFTVPQWMIAQGAAQARRRAGLERKTLRVGDSVLVYLDGGSGEAIVMLHGFGGDKDNFVPFAGALAQDRRIVIPDLFAFGESSLPPGAKRDLSSESQRILALLNALRIDWAHLVGCSMGGQLAVYFAAHFPERTRSLCLIGPSGLWQAPQTRIMAQIRQSDENPLVVRSLEDFKRSIAVGMLHPPKLPASFLKELAKPRIANAETEERLFRMLLDTPVDTLLERISMPVLIIFGAFDRIIDPATADYMQKKLGYSETAIIPTAAHVAMYEQPKETARRYEAFLTTCAQRTWRKQ
ncbi:alpha/beta hydrolase [Sulfurimonas sp. HSL1-6]|uniref:alpha/beta fold hydrolase n=1 Tax=Thiomicrolovo immobilis TaxID=3131935 RepID=UPI0031F9AEBA